MPSAKRVPGPAGIVARGVWRIQMRDGEEMGTRARRLLVPLAAALLCLSACKQAVRGVRQDKSQKEIQLRGHPDGLDAPAGTGDGSVETAGQTSTTNPASPTRQLPAPAAQNPSSQSGGGSIGAVGTAPTRPSAPAPQGTLLRCGEASYYGNELAGNRTASGEVFDPRQLTAAHPSLPFGKQLRVVLEGTQKSVTVRINDRGPFTGGRIIDLAEAAFRNLSGGGTARVCLYLLN